MSTQTAARNTCPPADLLCIECGVNPRAAEGRLSRCLSCIKAEAQRGREARAKLRAKAPSIEAGNRSG